MWFSKRKKEERAELAAKARQELVAQKTAQEEAAAEHHDANNELKAVLEENGFTLKIALALQRHHPEQRRTP